MAGGAVACVRAVGPSEAHTTRSRGVATTPAARSSQWSHTKPAERPAYAVRAPARARAGGASVWGARRENGSSRAVLQRTRHSAVAVGVQEGPGRASAPGGGAVRGYPQSCLSGVLTRTGQASTTVCRGGISDVQGLKVSKTGGESTGRDACQHSAGKLFRLWPGAPDNTPSHG